MRRRVGFALVALGLLFLVLAPLMRWYAYPQLAVVDDAVAGAGVETVAEGTDVTVLDVALVAAGDAEVTRATDVRSTRTTVADTEAGTEDVAVWDTEVRTVDTGAAGGEGELSGYDERVAFDRRTAEGVDGFGQFHRPGADPAAEVEVAHTGHYFGLPFDTQQVEYEVWDSTLQGTRPAAFDGEDEIDGLTVYRFVQEIEPTVQAETAVPGRLFGAPEPSVTASRIYSNTRTLWVEPVTGAVIRAQEEPHTFLSYAEATPVTVFQGTIGSTDDTVAANVEAFGDKASSLTLVRTTLPVLAVVAGAAGLAAGVILARTRKERYEPRRAAAAEWNAGPGSFDDLRETPSEHDASDRR